ncbi:hypothetical protein PoB_005714700 [Plakobranchus ocellatus]|uniref:Uncharacterized protein n=1 Tax=Plakobranchus ocellatus TaxID=259542 RepID=A0AAV4CGB5_9GAST|nr:hypothetical protein PoB_005714700 [Plakobranchus ocellatus]
MSESDPGFGEMDTLSLDETSSQVFDRSSSDMYLAGTKRRSKKRQAKLERDSSTEVSQGVTSGGDAAASDGDTLSNGDTPVRSKSRIRLWDSFLSKTRRIRIRKPRDSSRNAANSADAAKLQARASSQPNIPVSTGRDRDNFHTRPVSTSSPEDANKTFPGAPSNGRWSRDSLEDEVDHVDRLGVRRGDDGNEEDDEDEEGADGSSRDIRRAAYRHAPELSAQTRTKSSSSNELDESAYDHSTPANQAVRSRVGRRFFHRHTPDDGYRSGQEHNSTGSVDKVSRLPPSGNKKSRAVDSHDSIGSTPRSSGIQPQPRSLSHTELRQKDSVERSEDGDRDVTRDPDHDTYAMEDGEEEDGVPVIEHADLQVSPVFLSALEDF